MADPGRPHGPLATALPRDPTLTPLQAARAEARTSPQPGRTPTWPGGPHGAAHRGGPAGTVGGRHRRDLGPRPGWWPAAVAALPGAALLALLTVLVLTGVALHPLLTALAVTGLLPVLGTPIVRLVGVTVPDPLGRTALGCAVGLVALVVLAVLLTVVDASPTASVLALDLLAVLLAVAAGLLTRPAPRRPRVRLDVLRGNALRLGVPVLLPVSAALLVTHPVAASSPRGVTVVLLTAVLVALAVLSLRRRPLRRARAAVLVHATGWTLLTAVAHTRLTSSTSPSEATTADWSAGSRGAEALSRFVGDLGAQPADAVLLVVLPAVAALLPVLVWLVAERVVGPRRAPLVLTLFLAFPIWISGLPRLLAVDLALVPLAAVVLLSVGGAGAAPGVRRRRQGLALGLALGAVVTHTATGGLAALQSLLVALVTLGARRRRGPLGKAGPQLSTVPWAAGLAVLTWVWLVPVSGHGSDLAELGRRSWLTLTGRAGTAGVATTTDPGLLPTLWWLWPVAVAVGLLVLVLGRARPPVRDTEFLVSAAAAAVVALAVVIVPPVGEHPVVQAYRLALLVLAVPALLGIGSVVSLLGSWAGQVTDTVGRRRAPATWPRSTPRHRGRPARILRTALVPLVVFSVTTGLLPAAVGTSDPLVRNESSASTTGSLRRG